MADLVSAITMLLRLVEAGRIVEQDGAIIAGRWRVADSCGDGRHMRTGRVRVLFLAARQNRMQAG
jgi:hypothetical protein